MAWKKLTSLSGDYKVFLLNDIHIKDGFDGNPTDPGAVNENGRHYYASPNNLRDFVRKANAEKPDLVVLLGDMCDIPSNWGLFNEIWSGLDDTIPRVVTVGNHDFDVETFPQLLDILRYKGKKEVAGSKFNQSFSLNKKGFGAKFIMIDSSFDGSDNHGSHWQNIRVHTSSLPWLQAELENATESNVFIGTHSAPHLVDINYFDPTQKAKIQTIIDNAVIENPALKVTWFFGHHHLVDIVRYDNMGVNSVGYLLPALILDEKGRFTELTIKKDSFTLTNRTLEYNLI